MTTTFAINLVEEVNARLRPQAVLDAIGFHADKSQQAGETIKAFCPIHQDSRFRSMLVDGERNGFRCTIKTCAGYNGGSLVDLYALSLDKTVLQAACALADHLEHPLEDGWKDHLVNSQLDEASIARERGDYTEAETLLQELAGLATGITTPRIRLASLHEEMGKTEQAAEEYVALIDDLIAAKDSPSNLEEATVLTNDALGRFPANEDVRFASVRLAEAIGNSELAIARMQDIIKIRENDNRQLDNIGLLEQLVQIAPDRPEFAIKLGGLYEQQHNVRAASRLYEDVANYYIKSGAGGQAIEWLEKVVQFSSENVKVRLLLAKTLSNLGILDKARDHTFRVVNQHIDLQEFGNAITVINDWLAIEPDSVPSRELLARAFLEQERTAEAAAYLVEGATLAAAARDHSAAADLLLRAKYLIPDDVQLRRRLIHEFQSMDDHQRAAFEIIDVAEMLFAADKPAEGAALLSGAVAGPISVPLKLQMLTSLLNHDAHEAASEHLHQIAAGAQDADLEVQADLLELMERIEPAVTEHHLRHADLLWSVSPVRSIDSAADSATVLLKHDNPEGAAAVIALIAERLEDYYPEARRLITLAQEANRLDLAGLIYQSTIQGLADEDPATALKLAQRMNALDPQHPSASSDIAFLLVALERPVEAATQYASVAQSLLSQGDYENGLQYAREATALNPGSIPAAAMQAQLARYSLPPEEAAPLAEQLLGLLESVDDAEAAEVGFSAAADLFPEDVGLLERAAETLLKLGRPHAAAGMQTRQASRFIEQGDWDAAVSKLRVAVATAPDVAEILEQYGEASRVVGDTETAAGAFADAAAAYTAHHNMSDAARCLESARLAAPTTVTAWEKLFAAADSAGDDDTAQVAAQSITVLFKEAGPAASTARWAREWVRLAPSSAVAHQTLGQAFVAIHQQDNASPVLSTAAALYARGGNEAEALSVLDDLITTGYFSADDLDLLQEIRNRAKSGVPLHFQATVLLGKAYISRDNLADARKLISKSGPAVAAALWPLVAKAAPTPAGGTEAWLAAAHARRAGGDLAGATAALQAALKLGVPTAAVFSNLADVLTEQGLHDAALPHYLELLPHLAKDDKTAFGSLLARLRLTHAENLQALIQVAQALLQAGRRDLAAQDLDKAATLASAANDTAALVTICGIDEELTRTSAILNRARADALMGMENEQQALEWIADSARSHAAAENFDEALQMSERWVSLRPKDVEGRRLYAISCLRTGQPDKAVNAYLKTAELQNQSGDLAGALSSLSDLDQVSPENLEGLRLKISVLKKMGNDSEAANAACALAQALEDSNPDEAKAVYEECIALNPSHVDALWRHAELTNAVDGTVAAVPLYRRWAYARKEVVDASQWILDLEKLVPVLPPSAPLLRDLTEALLQLGRPTEALPYLETYARLLIDEGDFPAAAALKETILLHTAVPTAAQHLELATLYEKGNSNTLAQDQLRHAARLYQQSNEDTLAASTFDRLLALAGKKALPEDYSLAAKAHAHAGNKPSALKLLDKAFDAIKDQTGNEDRKERLLALALEIDPLNADFATRHMELLPAGRAMAEGMRTARAMQAAGFAEDAVTVLTQVVALAPHDMSLRQQLFEPLRQTGNVTRLRQELLTLASDALSSGDTDAAVQALDEAAELVKTAQQYRTLAELNERAQRADEAADQFIAAALLFAETGKMERAIASINRAVSAKPAAIPAELMAQLLDKIGMPLFDVAREQLRADLSARRQKQSQILALALMSAAGTSRMAEILRTVYTLGGSSILAGISHKRIGALLDAGDLAAAREMAQTLLDISPDSPDSWHLSARVNNSAGDPESALRSAMEAARLYSIAGAVAEEEDSYREAVIAAPHDPSVASTFADFLAREHRPDEAIEILLTVIENAELSGNLDVKMETLNRAVQIAPGNTDLREKLANLLETIAPDSAVDQWVQTADIYKESGEWDKARKCYDHALTLNPRNEKALYSLMIAAREDADLPAAAALTNRLAEVKASKRNVGEACRLLQAHLEIDPDNLATLEQLSDLSGASNDQEVFITTTRALARKFQKMGDNAEALRHYEQLLVRTPRDVSLLTTLLDCAAAADKPEKGLLYARQLLEVARETEDPDKIRLAAATILNYDDSDANARRDLAESLLSLNRVTEAVTEFLRAAELYESEGSNAAAFTCYRRVTQISPGTLQGWRRLANVAFNIGDTETGRLSVTHALESTQPGEAARVLPLLTRLLEVMPESAEAHRAALDFHRRCSNEQGIVTEALWLAQKAVSADQHDAAEALFKEALQHDPDNPEVKQAHYQHIRQMGRLEELQLRLRDEAEKFMTEGDSGRAITALRELASLASGQIAVHRDLAELLEREGQADMALQEYLQVIRMLLERGELEEARENAETLVARYPATSNCGELVADLLAETAYPDLAARFFRAAADAAKARQDHAENIRLLTKAVKARPFWADARAALAAAHDAAGQPELACNAWLELVPVLMENGEFLEATTTLSRLAKSHPDSLPVREQLAALYEKTGRKEEFTETLRSLADIYDRTGDKLKAIHAYQRLAAVAPNDPDIMTRYLALMTDTNSGDDLSSEYANLAEALARSGDVEGAFQAYEHVLSKSPDNTHARSRYAAFLLTRGSRNRALAEMRHLGALYMQRGEAAAAVEVLNAALTIAPRDAELCLSLANAQESAGLVEDARVSYARASAILASTAAVKGIDTYRRILSMDEENTPVRLRLIELLIKSGDKMEAAREARILAEIHINRGELAEAEHAYSLVDQCEPETVTEIREAIQRDSYDPSLQYLHYVRLGNFLFAEGDIDNALDSYRTARSLHDDQPQLIQKCIDCVSLIAPEAEAITDYLLMAEKLLMRGAMGEAREAYEKVRLIDPFNNDARCGIESVTAAENQVKSQLAKEDDMVLKTNRTLSKRVGLTDLLIACQEAAQEQPLRSKPKP